MTGLFVLAGAALMGVSLLVAVPALVFFLELAAVTWRGAAPPAAEARRRGASLEGVLAVLMPAHDEAQGIVASIRSVRAQLGPRDRLLVVADNCTDATAEMARAAGAEVVERHDPERRGKGYALDFGVRWLARKAPALVVVVDADCLVAPGALAYLAADCLATGRPVQALYLMRAPPQARLGARIAEFAWLVKNKLRPAGAALFGWPCQLMGTGMAFPWTVIAGAPLASSHLVEDMQLGLALASSGRPPLFCERSLVTSVFPSDREGAKSQRNRWEHGHLSVILQSGPHLVWRAIVRRDAALLAMALDLLVPPLASLAVILGVMCLTDAIWWSVGGGPGPLAVAIVGLAWLCTGVLAGWFKEARHLVSGRELLALPIYMMAKVPIYIRLFTKRQVDWVRTKRDDRSR